MSEQKKARKFDLVTILGVGAAIVLFIGGQMWLGHDREVKRIAWEKEQAQRAKEQEEIAKARAATQPAETTPVMKSGDSATTAPNTSGTSTTPAQGTQAVEAEVKLAPDIVVQSEHFDLTFTARGAALGKATFGPEYIDPRKKDVKGLEFLSEIEAGKMTFGIRSMEVIQKDGQRIVFDQMTGPAQSPAWRVWKLESDSGAFDSDGVRTIVYSVTFGGKYTLRRTYTIRNGKRVIEESLALKNAGDQPVVFTYTMYGPAGVLLDGPKDDPKTGAPVFIKAEMAGRPANPAGGEPDVLQIYSDQTSWKEPDRTVSREENPWACVKNRFYTAMVVPVDPAQVIRYVAEPLKVDVANADKRLAEPNITVVIQRRNSAEVAPGTESPADGYGLYMGPSMPHDLQDAEAALKLKNKAHLDLSVQYVELFYKRWPLLDKFARGLLVLFRWLYDVFGNYGMAVILLTLVIKLCLHPLQRKMMVSMNKLQKIQPELKKLQEKYKGQTSMEARQKMALEQRDLMAKAGANPMSGCLPMFIQIPVFSGLYGIFNAAYPIRGADFLWIKDLSQADQLMTFSFFPNQLNLLPLIYAVTTIVQARLSAAPPSDDPAQEMNRKMMMYMPTFFALIFYKMPSGLVLYFAAQAVFGVIEYWYIKKYHMNDDNGTGTVTVQVSKKPPAPVVN